MRSRRPNFVAALTAALFLAASLAAQTARPDFNRKQTYDVQHYKIVSSFDHAKREIDGDTTITLKPLAAGFSSAEFDAVALRFSSVTLEPSGTELKFRTAGDKVIVTLDRAYGTGDVLSIRLRYTATKPRKGVYFVDAAIVEGTERRSAQIYTQGEPDEHRHWFPSFDFPSDKATTEQILTAPSKDFSVIANGELISKTDNPNGTVTWHYKMPVPHSSYLISFIIGKYAKVEERYKDIPLGYYVYPGQEALVPKAYGSTKEMMAFFEDVTKFPYPYNKYDQTVVSAFNFGGMENITATTMADTEIAMANIDFLRGSVEDLVSHELAHSWFGNLVTCRNWAELWLNEGFATFMEAAWREHKNGPHDYMQKIQADAENYMAGAATMPKPIGLFNMDAANVDALFDRASVTYNKGGAVLHQLRRQVGDDAFWKGVNIYLNRHKFGSVETPDLLRSMEEASGQQLDWFFDQWVYGIGYPRLTVTPRWNAARRTLTVTVTQTQRTGGLNIEAYRLPIKIHFDYGPLGKTFEVGAGQDMNITRRVQTFTYKLARKPRELKLDPEGRVLIKTVKIQPIK